MWWRELARYRRDRSQIFRKAEMPRTATGKILHRVLQTQLMDAAEH